MPKRPCLTCGVLTEGKSYCTRHSPERRSAPSPSSRATGRTDFSKLRAEVYLREGGRCYLCGGQVDQNEYHVDHVIPVSRGGTSDLANLALTHPACNIRKGGG